MASRVAAPLVAALCGLLLSTASTSAASDLRAIEKRAQESLRVRGDRDPETLGILADLALAHESQGRFVASERAHARVLARRLEVLERHHPDTLETMRHLARVRLYLGRYEDALALLQRAAAGSRARFGPRAPETLDAMASLVKGHIVLGRYRDALPIAEETLSIGREVRVAPHPALFAATADLALLYRMLDQPARALSMEQALLAEASALWGERSPAALDALQAAAESHAALGRHGEAAELMERSLALREAVHGEEAARTIVVLPRLASVYEALGRREEAAKLERRARAVGGKAFGDADPRAAQVMYLLGGEYNIASGSADAIAISQHALKLAESQGESSPHVLPALLRLAVSYERAGRLEEAAAIAPRYAAAAERSRSASPLPPEILPEMLRDSARGYRYFSRIHGMARRGEEGFMLLEQGKARSLLDAMTAQRAERSGALPAAERARLEAAERRSEALRLAEVSARDERARVQLHAERIGAHWQAQGLRAALQRKYPKFAQLSAIRIVRAAELGDLVEPGSIAVSYGVGTDETLLSTAFAWVTDGRGFHFVDLGPFPHLEELVDAVRRASGHPRGLAGMQSESGLRVWRMPSQAGYRLLDAAQPAPVGAQPARDLAELARYCAARLLEPLRAHLEGKARWTISPDGPLAQLPFETLPWGPRAAPAVMSADIHYVQSLSVMALARAREKEYAALAGRRPLFAMGNPVYAPAAQSRPAARRAGPVAVRTPAQLRDLDAQWPNLPGTEREVRAVAEIFGPASSVHLGSQATEHHLQALNATGELARYRYLLFSAHGYLSEAEPALSSLVLGLVDRAPGTDGYVTAAEWPGYDLRSDVAVFSACDTGLGRVSSGEGVLGLPFALFVAGNVNTILSLWPIEDDATVEFVKALFTRLHAGVPAARALAETKRAFIAHPPQERFSSPSVWAPFILVGPG